jgi:hypothetical protein
MKRAGIALALIAGITLTGCASPEESVKDDYKEITVEYRERELHCILTTYDRSASVTCDFERFYAENPETATLNDKSTPLPNQKGNK